MNIQMVFFFSSLFLGVVLVFFILKKIGSFASGPLKENRRKSSSKLRKFGAEKKIMKLFDSQPTQSLSEVEKILDMPRSIAEECLWELVVKGKILKTEENGEIFYQKI